MSSCELVSTVCDASNQPSGQLLDSPCDCWPSFWPVEMAAIALFPYMVFLCHIFLKQQAASLREQHLVYLIWDTCLSETQFGFPHPKRMWALVPRFIKCSSLLEFLRYFPSPSHFVVHSPNADEIHSGYLVSLFLCRSLCCLLAVVFGSCPRMSMVCLSVEQSYHALGGDRIARVLCVPLGIPIDSQSFSCGFCTFGLS